MIWVDVVQYTGINDPELWEFAKDDIKVVFWLEYIGQWLIKDNLGRIGIADNSAIISMQERNMGYIPIR